VRLKRLGLGRNRAGTCGLIEQRVELRVGIARGRRARARRLREMGEWRRGGDLGVFAIIRVEQREQRFWVVLVLVELNRAWLRAGFGPRGVPRCFRVSSGG